MKAFCGIHFHPIHRLTTSTLSMLNIPIMAFSHKKATIGATKINKKPNNSPGR